MAEGGLERVVQHGRAHVQEGLHGRPAPAHLLLLGHALGYDLVDRAFHERRRDRLTTLTPGGVGHQRAPIALEVAQKIADVSLEAADAGHLAYRLASRPAAQGSELAPAPRPAPVPQAPLRPVQVANRVVGEGRVSRAKAAGRLPRVLKADSGVPPVQHDRGARQRLALQPPQPGIAVAQHRRCMSAPTLAAASACLNASTEAARPLRAKAKRCWAPRASMILPATTSK